MGTTDLTKDEQAVVEKRRDDALRRALTTPPKPKQESEAESKKKQKKDQD